MSLRINTITVEGVTLEFDLIDEPGNIRRDGNAVIREVVTEINQLLLTRHFPYHPKVIVPKEVKITVVPHELIVPTKK